MSQIPCPVQACDRPRRGNEPVCGACASQLARDLTSIPELARELDITISRQAVIGTGGGSDQLPFNDRASAAATRLRNVLVVWVHALLAGQGNPPTPLAGPTHPACAHSSCIEIRANAWLHWFLTRPADSVPAMGTWLAHRETQLLRHPAADKACTAIGAAVDEAWKAINRPPEMVYAGPCTCGTDLYAKPGGAYITCPTCEAQHHIEERKTILLAAIRDRLMTASQVAPMLTQLLGNGTALKPAVVRNWALRDRILAHGEDRQGRPLYLVADVEAKFVEMLERQAARDAKVAS